MTYESYFSPLLSDSDKFKFFSILLAETCENCSLAFSSFINVSK